MVARATVCLNQEDLLGGTMIVDAYNGFNDLIRMVMLWTL